MRYNLIKKMLYDPSIKTFDLTIKSPSKPTPHPNLYTGKDQDLIEQDIIERQWSIYKQQEMAEFISLKKKQYDSIRWANTHLEKFSKPMFENTKIIQQGLFPKRMRIPADTMPELGWDYDMNRN
jgi:hypothetical protein